MKSKTLSLLVLAAALAGCSNLADLTTPEASSATVSSDVYYSITYKGNGNSSGSAPTDSSKFKAEAVVTLATFGDLAKTGYYFNGWKTAASGGTLYAAGSSFTMLKKNAVFYADWQAKHGVTYYGNGSTSGSVPTDSTSYGRNDVVTVQGNTGSLVMASSGSTDYFFVGWNTKADGTGVTYAAGSSFKMGSAAQDLYAVWSATPVYIVTYVGNGETAGTPPSDSTHYKTGDSVTVRGNTGSLVRTGYTLTGWNTAANGSGTAYSSGAAFAMGSANVILYAQWTTRLFVAVGASGSVYTSVDGVTWSPNYGPGGSAILEAVTYGSYLGFFVACGTDDNMYRSSDGVTWTAASVPVSTAGQLRGMAYMGGMYAASALDAKAWYSTNAVNWIASTIAVAGYDMAVGTFGGIDYFLMGANGGWCGYATISGITTSSWSSTATGGSADGYGFSYGNGAFIGVNAAGQVFRCTDWLGWTNIFTNGGIQMNDVGFGNNSFVGVGNSGYVCYSADTGINWTPTSVPSGANMNDVCYGDGKFVAVGAGGAIHYSLDNGATWSANVGPGTEDLLGICFRP